MSRTRQWLASIAGVATAIAGVSVISAPAAQAAPADHIVISEVYGGGGNAGATYKRDFIELYNPTASTVDLTGWSVQYRSATGATIATAINTTNLSGSIAPGAFFLIEEAAGAGGTVDLPSPDITGGTIAIAGGGGQVWLSNSTTLLNPPAGNVSNPAIVDFVGFATNATSFETQAIGVAPSNSTAAYRAVYAEDSNNNNADFQTASPTPGEAPSEPPTDPTEATIAEIQGDNAMTSPMLDELVVTEGVVTAAYPTGGFFGFYLQTEGTGGTNVDPATRTHSDGIFVRQAAGSVTAEPGDFVSVTGTVKEFAGQTQVEIPNADAIEELAGEPDPIVATTTSSWPATNAQKEALEGMLYTPQGDFTITNNFDTNTFGELGLARGDQPLIQPTEVGEAGSTAAADAAADNAARAIVLDDGSSQNYTNAANQNQTPPYISNDTPWRTGATGTFNSDVILAQGGSPSAPTYRFQPTARVVGPDNVGAPFTASNTRTNAPDEDRIAASGTPDLKVASFNVLNYFTTLGDANDDNIGDGGCVAFNDRDGDGNNVSTGCDQRGAWDPEDLERQQTKIVHAINALDADVVGLMEIENSAVLGETADEATETLVAALNADAGAGTWAANPSSADLPPVSEMDVISNAIIYKPASVNRVGESLALGDQSTGNNSPSDEPFANAREPIGQVFEPADGGAPFLVVVNHFKSKGSAGPFPGDADQGDGQGAANQSRIRQAQALRDWIPTVQGDVDDVILLGDFNSYTMEDPLQVLYDAGYQDAEVLAGHDKYSYSFSGLSGSLDHVLGNAGAVARFTGADIWNVNSVESVAMEYSRWNYSATDFHTDAPFRASDHDPVVVGLTAGDDNTAEIQILGTNDFHGRIANDSGSASAGAAVMAGAVKQLRGENPNTVFAAAGDLIGASTFESFIDKDKPTIDALNSAGLEVSSVGNHEFDQGYDDLVNRVMAIYDPTTNPKGGAEWEYIGANLRMRDTHEPTEIAPSWTETLDGVEVGFIGAVTEHLPELVSPAGIADIEVTDIVDAVNAEAEELKADGADVIVLLVHEGAGGTNCETMDDDPTSDFGKIISGVNDDIDAIISGHTHLEYNCSFPVEGWAGRPVTERPVVSAGQYGYALNQIVFMVDKATGEVQAKTQAVLKLKAANGGPFNYPVDAPTQAIVDAAVANAAVLGAQPLGQLADGFRRAKFNNGTTENRGGESTLGNLVAEAQRWATEQPESGSAQIAFMNPGGLRADMVGGIEGETDYPKTLTYKQAANVQPFANTLVNMDLTGAQIKATLEQQWQPAGASRPFLRLGVSEGFTYTYDPSKAAGARITGMWLDGTPIDESATYSVTVNSFLASGGDNFTALAGGTGKQDTGKTDLQGMVDYMAEFAATPLAVDYAQRAVGVKFPNDAPDSYAAGDHVKFDLSSLSMTDPLDQRDTEVSVTLGGTDLGTFPVATDLLPPGDANSNDEAGTASVDVVLPAGTPSGDAELVVTGDVTGTSATVPITVDNTVDVQILGTNDFHGRIANDPSSASAGAAVMAGAVKQLRGENPNTVFAAAGDLIGASTFESFIDKDKPTIDALNSAGLDVSSVGNHEFDQGYDDLVNRVMAIYDPTTNPKGGAEWEYIGANLRMRDTHEPTEIAPSWTETLDGVEVGFIGAVTEHLPELVSPAGIADIEVTDIVDAVNEEAEHLKNDEGADIIVLLVHEGAGGTDCATMDDDPTSDFGKIISGVNDDIDAIISGHTHLEYNCSFPVEGWAGRPVTERPVVSAGQYGYALNQIVFSFDKDSGEVQAKSQAVLKLKNGTSGSNFNYPVDAPTQEIVDAAVANAEVLGAAPLGKIGGKFARAKFSDGTTENRGGESTLGNLVAEAQRWATEQPESGSAQIAFMNPGGLRADMAGNPGGYPATLTYKQAATVQPFANTLVNMDLTGAQIKATLEQQWQPAGSSRPFLRLGVSEGFTYTYDPSRAEGDRITGMWLDGTPIDQAATYSVTVNSFLASGGDNFTTLASGTNKQDTGKTDLQGMVDYMAAHAPTTGTPLPVDYSQRAVGVKFPSGAPSSYVPGTDHVKFDLSSLAMTDPSDLQDANVKVSLGGTELGTFPVTVTLSTPSNANSNDEAGTASVDVVLPAGTPAGTATLLVTGASTATAVRVPVQVASTTTSPTPTPTQTATTVSGTAATYAYGTAGKLTVTVSPSTATGQVQVTDEKGKSLGSVTLAGGTGQLTLGATALKPGTHTLTLKYAGDTGHLASQGTVSVKVTKAKSTVTIKAPKKVKKGVKTTITVKVKAKGVKANGKVKLVVKGGKTYTGKVKDGKATFKVKFAKSGNYKLTAKYQGNDLVAKSKGTLKIVV